ncbi:aromatic ring-hydroxylating oxygenase subunit alpha [Pseudonocardia sp. GCM10023141]|uniref:aromatic ring-hydroxylating oxygenase subunit alpha n=1 Tax=Pseudonocardia sp. GCM10023141 TaxID=3252653 RepID=UPI003620972B
MTTSAEPPAATMSYDDMVRPDAVHRAVYTDPAVFVDEMTRVFARVWVFIAHESEIPEPHDYVTRDLAGRPVIITRTRTGEVRVLLNRCRHRGATVCREPAGKARRFTCPYHGWAYDNSGELTGVPWPDAYGEDFKKADYPLLGARVETRHGFIFATLNPDAPGLSEYLGAAEEKLDMWVSRFPESKVAVRHGRQRMLCRANWKLVLDNSIDGYHPAFSHRALLHVAARHGDGRDMGYFAEAPDDSPLYVQYLGNGHGFLDQRPAYSGAGSYFERQRPAPGREHVAERVRGEYPDEQATEYLDLSVGAQMNFTIFPNLLFVGNQIQVLEPKAVDETVLSWYATSSDGLPDPVTALRMRHQEDFPNFGEPDDLANFAECQRGLGIPEIEWVLMNRGFGAMDRVKVDGDIVTAPVTHEISPRGYFEFWRKLMSQEV